MLDMCDLVCVCQIITMMSLRELWYIFFILSLSLSIYIYIKMIPGYLSITYSKYILMNENMYMYERQIMIYRYMYLI